MNLSDPRLLQAVLDGLPDAFVLADVQGVIHAWNPAAQRLFGFTREEAVGENLNLIVPERFRAAHDAGFARAIATGELRVAGRVMRTRANHKDGRKLYVDFAFALLKDAQGSVVGVYSTARDATEAHLKAQGAAAS
ncbi:MAG: PAS domain S-box protein [Comamonadaceae bacterium]|nr:MAG: PAS domain S-box protein [Comamonadaceae bacterium]